MRIAVALLLATAALLAAPDAEAVRWARAAFPGDAPGS